MSPHVLLGLAVLVGSGASGPAPERPTVATANVLPVRPEQQGPGTVRLQPDRRKMPFEKLQFDQSQAAWERLEAQLDQHRNQSSGWKSPQVKVVCGMRVFQVDASEDPKMVLHAPDSGDMKIRRIEPPVCTE